MKIKGNRTHITALVTAAVVSLDNRFSLNIPMEVYALLGFLVMYFLRLGISNGHQGTEEGREEAEED